MFYNTQLENYYLSMNITQQQFSTRWGSNPPIKLWLMCDLLIPKLRNGHTACQIRVEKNRGINDVSIKFSPPFTFYGFVGIV